MNIGSCTKKTQTAEKTQCRAPAPGRAAVLGAAPATVRGAQRPVPGRDPRPATAALPAALLLRPSDAPRAPRQRARRRTGARSRPGSPRPPAAPGGGFCRWLIFKEPPARPFLTRGAATPNGPLPLRNRLVHPALAESLDLSPFLRRATLAVPGAGAPGSCPRLSPEPAPRRAGTA